MLAYRKKTVDNSRWQHLKKKKPILDWSAENEHGT